MNATRYIRLARNRFRRYLLSDFKERTNLKVNINIDVAPTILALGGIGILIAVLFFNETAYKRLLQLLEAVVKALSALAKLRNK